MSPFSAGGQEFKGGVRGKVIDPEFNAPLPNATVVLEGAGRSVQTGQDGSFTISDIPPGSYELSVAREGYNRARVGSIVVNEGRFSETTVELSGQVVELEDFIVSAEDLIGTQEFQLDIQQSLTSFANVLGADFISKIGASDVGKALQKVVGVTVIGDRYVVVRGLADRYNAVLLNDLPVASSDPDRRAVNLDLFPGSIVQSLQTYKTFTPDLQGEATGGSINIVTKSVPENDYTKVKLGLGFDTNATGNSQYLTYPGGGTGMLGTIDSRRLPDFIRGANLSPSIASGAGQLDDQAFRDKVNAALPRTMGAVQRAPGPDIIFESTVGRRFEFWGKPAGMLLGLDYRKQFRFDPDGFEGRYSFGPDGNARLAFRRVNVTRGTETLRGSLLLVGGVQPQPGDEVKLTIFTNVTAQDRAALRFGAKDTVPIGPIPEGTDGTYRESLTYTERRLHILQASGRHHWDGDTGEEKAVFKWSASYNRASQLEPDHRFSSSDTTPDFSTYFFPGALPIPPVRRYWRELFDDRYNFGAHSELLLFSNGEKKAKLKFGGLFDVSTRDYRTDNYAYNINEESTPFPGPLKPSPYPGATLGDVWNYGNKLNVQQTARPDLGHYLFRFTPPEIYDAFQAIPAAYTMIDADITEKLNATFGLRWEQTRIKIEASDISQIEEGLGVIFLPPEDRTPQNVNDLLAGGERAKNNPAVQAARFARLDETHVLPSFTLKYKVADTMNLRGSYSRTIARPSFKELAPVLFRDAETGDLFGGNQRLKISDIDNYDVRFEWYPKSGGVAALSLFSKFITNPIEKGNDGVERFFDGNDAVLYGAELEFDKDLSFLSESLRPISIGANYAYLKSVAQRERGSIFSGTRRLQGQPDYIFNFNLTFDEPKFGLTAGIFLNVTGVYLDSVGAGPVADIFVEPVTTLNAFLQYKFGKAGKLTLRANNLTSEPIRRVYDNGDRNVYDEFSTSTNYQISYELEF